MKSKSLAIAFMLFLAACGGKKSDSADSAGNSNEGSSKEKLTTEAGVEEGDKTPQGPTREEICAEFLDTYLAADKSSKSEELTALEAEVCDCFSEAAPFAGGDGSEESPYLICSLDQLAAINAHLDKDFRLLADIDASETNPEDEDYEAEKWPNGWKPLGSCAQVTGVCGGAGCVSCAKNYFPFAGKFDGNFYSVQNIHMDLSAIADFTVLGAEDDYFANLDKPLSDAAFFGSLSGEVRNLHLESTKATGKDSAACVALYSHGGLIENVHCSNVEIRARWAGGISQYATYSEIRNSKVEGTVAGGIVAGISAYLGQTKVLNNHFRGEVLGNNSGGLNWYAYGGNSFENNLIEATLRINPADPAPNGALVGRCGGLGPLVRNNISVSYDTDGAYVPIFGQCSAYGTANISVDETESTAVCYRTDSFGRFPEVAPETCGIVSDKSELFGSAHEVYSRWDFVEIWQSVADGLPLLKQLP